MLYSPKQAMEFTGVSHGSLRNYTRDYARYFSTEATTTPRKFTDDDVRVIACIKDLTSNRGLKHAQIVDELPVALETFEWIPPEPAIDDNTAADTGNGDIVPLATLRATQALLMDAKDREAAALAESKAANERIAELERELGEARGKLKAHYRAPEWWRKLFGGAGE